MVEPNQDPDLLSMTLLPSKWQINSILMTMACQIILSNHEHTLLVTSIADKGALSNMVPHLVALYGLSLTAAIVLQVLFLADSPV